MEELKPLGSALPPTHTVPRAPCMEEEAGTASMPRAASTVPFRAPLRLEGPLQGALPPRPHSPKTHLGGSAVGVQVYSGG